MIVISHPTGNAFVRNAAQSFDEAGLLAEFWTCINWDPHSLVAGLLPGSLRSQLARRSYSPSIQSKLRSAPWREMGRLIAPKMRLRQLTRHETGPLSVDAVYRSLDRRVAAHLPRVKGARAVYAYEDGACDTFRYAKEHGIQCLYDLPIGYWRAARIILGEEKERKPEWASTLTGLLDSEEKLARKDQELRLSDAVYVASSFTRQTLHQMPDLRARVHVIPYGAPAVVEESEIKRTESPKLRVLFVGSLGQRKGTSYLLDAVETLGEHVELTLIGKKPAGSCVPLEAGLRKHQWIETLPNSGVLEQMRQHDVLVFPSLFEGFGLVLLEAMSQGLPVITTAHTAGPDILANGEDGFIVPIRSSEAIAEKLSYLAGHRDVLKEMRFAAWEHAKNTTWAAYRDSLAHFVRLEMGLTQPVAAGVSRH